MTRKYDYSNWDASERTPSTEEQMKGFDIQDYFDLSDEEVQACHELILKTKEKILNEDITVKGFNIGTNSGKNEETSKRTYCIYVLSSWI